MSEPIYAQRYRAKRRLPAGRAAAAYAGHDAEGRPVVVTVVRPLDADVFLRTLGVVASVRHLDLVPVVDAGRDGADCFVVAEDPGGADAAALAARGPLPVATAALTAASAAAGLAALHEHGVVHGGVDPATVVRGEDGAIKLTGAGLAEAFPPPDLRPGTAPDIARYLSPEEVTGRAPSPASDVYRLGLVTYLLLTGRHAFDGADGSIVAQEQLDGVVQPPQLLNPEVPPALAQIVARALEKDPGARGTAAQFQADIERVLRSAQVQEAPPPPRSRMWVWLLALIVLALAALAIAWALGAFDGGGGAEVKVPDVTGMTEARAAHGARRRGTRRRQGHAGAEHRGPGGHRGGPVAGRRRDGAGGLGGRPPGRREPVPVRAGGRRRARRGRKLAGGRGGAAHRRRLHGRREPGAERHRPGRRRRLPGPAGRRRRDAGQHGPHRRLDGRSDAGADELLQPVS